MAFFFDFLVRIKGMPYFCSVKKSLFLFAAILVISCIVCNDTVAQCAMCTKTAQQLGEKPALGLNHGILYLMLAPFSIVGFIAYRWWKNNREIENQ